MTQQEVKTPTEQVQPQVDARHQQLPDQKELEGDATPRAMILTNMPGGYAKTQMFVSIRSFISRGGKFIFDIAKKAAETEEKGKGEKREKREGEREKITEQGGLYSLVNAIRDLTERGDRVERRGMYQINAGSGQMPTAQRTATIKDVAVVIEGLMMNNLVDVHEFKHLFIGYDPEKKHDRENFNGIFSEVILRRVFDKKDVKDELDLMHDPEARKKREEEIRSAIMHGEEYKKQLAEGVENQKEREKLEKAVQEYERHTDEVYEVRGEYSDRKIDGLMHRWKRRKPLLEKDFKSVTVADAVSIEKWAHEAGLKPDGIDAARVIRNRVIPTLKKSFTDTFNFIDDKGNTLPVGRIVDMLQHQYGLVFDETLTEHLGWMARDMAIRVQGQHMQVTLRVPQRWWWDRNARNMGLENPDAQKKADEKLALSQKAHDATLQEIEGRADLGVVGRLLAIVFHKADDNGDINKYNTLGEGNPKWKPDRCRHLCEEHFYYFREHVADRPNYENETEFERSFAQRIWDRLANVVKRDKHGNITNGAIEKRDAYDQDYKTEGVPTIHALMKAYLIGRWGGDDEESQQLRIRGYDMIVKDVWWRDKGKTRERDAIEDDSALGQTLLQRVNESRARNRLDALKHVDEISKHDVTDADGNVRDNILSAVGEVDTQIGGLGGNELIKRLGKTRLMHDIKRGTYIFLETYFRNLQLESSPDVNLRWRTVPINAPQDSTSMQQMRYIMTQMARDPNHEFGVDDRTATKEEAERMRYYAFAFRDSPETIARIFNSDHWREIASPEMADPKLQKKRLDRFQQYLNKNKELEHMAALVGKSELESGALLQTLMEIESRFVGQYRDVVDIAVKHAPEKEKDVQFEGLKVSYNKSLILEALKVSSPPSSPEGLDEEFGKIRLAQLLTKYGPRLKAMRKGLENPYDPRAEDLLGPHMATEITPLINDLAKDLFNSKDFGRIGESFTTESFKKFCEEQKIDSAQFANQRLVAMLFCMFLHHVDARHGGFGEQLQNTNSYGTAGLTPIGVKAGNLMDFISTVTDNNKFRITLDELSEQDANNRVRSPRSMRPGYKNTIILRGVSAEGALPNEEKGVRLLTEDPYTRPLMLNIARNQAAFLGFQRRHPDEMRDPDRVAEILRENNVSPTHEAYEEIRKRAQRGEDIDISQITRMLAEVKENALRATAEHLGIRNPNLVDFGRWINEYGNSLFEHSAGMVDKSQTNFDNAVTHLNTALGLAGRFDYMPGAEDLRVVTLKRRGWFRRDKIENAQLMIGDSRSETQLALDDFTAAWRYSRGEDPGLALVESRGPFRSLKYWYEQRFSNMSLPYVRGEDAEAAAGMGLFNSLNSNYAYIAGESRRGLWFRAATASGAIGAVSLIPAPFIGIPALIGAGAAVGAVWLNERLGVGEFWAQRAGQVLSQTRREEPDTEKQYIRAYKVRNTGLAGAQAMTNSGIRSWFRFLRNNWATFDWDSAGLSEFDGAVKSIDPLNGRHILHVSTARMDESQKPVLIEELYDDTYKARMAKMRALRGGARYYESDYGLLEEKSIPPENLPEAARLYDRVARNTRINPGIWGSMLGVFHYINPLSKYWGTRMAASSLQDYLQAHGDEVNRLDASINRGIGVTFGRLAAEEAGAKTLRNPRLAESYGRLAEENNEAAIAKYRNRFVEDNSIPTSDAIRDLIMRTIAHTEAKDVKSINVR